MPHLQLKDVPQGVHDGLRARASASGVSMREYVLRLIEADIGTVDTPGEMRERLERLPRADADAGVSAVEVLGAAREARDVELLGAGRLR